MLRLLPLILVLVLSVYCWVEIAQADPRQVRQLPRGLWALLVVIPLVGSIAWLVYGRPNGSSQPPAPPRPAKKRPLAPDDDPDFLRRIKRPPGDDEPKTH